MALSLSCWLLSVAILFFCSIAPTDAEIFYVKPGDDMYCTYQPSCRTLNEYVTQKEQYFLDNTTFMFLPGIHQLDVQLNVENLSNISFIGREEPLVQVSLSEAVNITWINCDNIELSRLVFFVEGDRLETISALYFCRTIGVLSYLSFLGNVSIMFRAIFLNDSSEIMIYNIHVNRAFSYRGAALCCLSSTITLHGHNNFTNNLAFRDGGAVELFNCTSMFFGSISFLHNSAGELGGAVSIGGDGYSFFSGNIFMVENKAYLGGAMAIMGSKNTSLFGNISFVNNLARSKGGAMFVIMTGGIFTFSQNLSFINNTAHIGGAIAVDKSFVTDTALNFTGFSRFEGNSAQQGRAMAFLRGSKLMLSDPLQMKFVENHAELTGGAIFFGYDIDDTFSNHCTERTPSSYEMPDQRPCFIEFSSLENIYLTFRQNTAGDTGSVLRGTDLYNCELFTGCGAKDSCGNSINGAHDNLPNTIRKISDIIHDDDIISDPLQVLICVNNYHRYDTLNLDTIPGKELKLEAMVVGQGVKPVLSSVRILQNNDVQVGSNQFIQPTGKQCTPIRYRFFAKVKNTTVTLFPNNCISEMLSMKLTINFLPCPDGFVLVGSQCTCEERLNQFNVSCYIDDSSIERTTNSFWIGAVYDNDSYEGLILHSGGCPFDYCLDMPANITLDSLDSQCNYNHTGMLCGPCRDNHSIAFGTLHCLACSNAYLALLLPFAVMGAALVAMLLLLNLSVAVGTIHGLIFYANVVQAARSTFFPPEETNILTVFIAWLNLDLGIESCFYDGMNAYAFTWLQFLFPFYVWFLIGLLIVVSRLSGKISRSLGSNPVATLATLFLLSYSKILRNIIAVLSVSSLQYPDESNKLVWLYDGSVPYFQRSDHFFLGIFSLLLLVFVFLPYTLFLLCGPWFQAYSNWKIFSWANKLMPLIDAYHAPYKKKTRYWPGLVLLVRCAMFAAFTLTSLDNSHFELVLITSLTVGLAALAWAHRGVYESFHSDLLEASFILNLCILAAATYHVQQTGGSQAALAYTSVSVAFVMFIFIVLYHLYLAVRKTSTWKKFIQLQSAKKYRLLISQLQGNENVDTVDEKKVSSAATLSLNIPTTVIELREPLLASTRN